MPQKLLGIDIGSYSIKAALFETTFRSFELTDLFESTPLKADDLPPEDRAAVATEAVIRLLEENSITPSTVVSALPGASASTRIMTLPLPEKQIERVLPFELEAQLPFDLNQIIIDHYPIAAIKGSTTILAAAVAKAIVAEHLSILRGAQLEPAFVGLDSLMLSNLNQMALSTDDGTYAIVDIGHRKTSVCIISNHRVQYVRALMTAGKALTEAIRVGLDLTWDQATEVKHDHGIIELDTKPLKSKDLRRLSGAIRKGIDPLIGEMIQTFHAYRAQQLSSGEDVPAIERIYLCGGTGQLRNLPEYMTAFSGIPVEPLRFFPDGHEVSERLGERESVLAQAVGIGLRAAGRGAGTKRIAAVNFRKGEFAFAQDLSGLHRKAFFFGKWVAALFVVALLGLGMEYQNLSRQHRALEKTVVAAFRQIVPNAKKPPKNSTQALRILQGQIKNDRKRLEIVTGGLYGMTALGILREFSQRIPADISIDTQEIAIDQNKITLRANTDSFASVDKIIASLREVPEFQKIDKGDIRESPDGKKTFQLTVTVESEEEEEEKGGRR